MLNWLKNNIPNGLTASNLACGILGILLIGEKGISSFETVGILIICAGVFDFFDGFSARLLGSSSGIGKDLDSLADLVTFGVLPTVMIFTWMKGINGDDLPFFLRYFPLSIGIFSAIRLAIFNNDTRQSEQFIGLPTPANAFFLVFLVIWQSKVPTEMVYSEWTWVMIMAVSSFLLVSPIPLIALKFKTFSIKNNWPRWLVITGGAVSLAFFGVNAIPGIILLYIGVSIVSNFLKNE